MINQVKLKPQITLFSVVQISYFVTLWNTEVHPSPTLLKNARNLRSLFPHVVNHNGRTETLHGDAQVKLVNKTAMSLVKYFDGFIGLYRVAPLS